MPLSVVGYRETPQRSSCGMRPLRPRVSSIFA